jgi:hypothetical protein
LCGIVWPCIGPHPSTFSYGHLLIMSNKRGLRPTWQWTSCSKLFISIGWKQGCMTTGLLESTSAPVWASWHIRLMSPKLKPIPFLDTVCYISEWFILGPVSSWSSRTGFWFRTAACHPSRTGPQQAGCPASNTAFLGQAQASGADPPCWHSWGSDIHVGWEGGHSGTKPRHHPQFVVRTRNQTGQG